LRAADSPLSGCERAKREGEMSCCWCSSNYAGRRLC
jgi:hypothetical protein